ncbi:hypothetical protein ACIF8T_18200 [Streptomyces sp. NPDC085946]|uniref:hypothetical protein n=1 Tax=Streptomyces sp. NPDC085946 TaxID=3365744 RepID=UPI0037D14620
MAWEEWEQLKSAAVERHRARMQLNQLPAGQGSTGPGGGGAHGRLRSDKKAWSAAGEGVAGLRDDIGKALTKLEDGQTGLGGSPGCLTAAAQKKAYDSWVRRVKDISGLCDGLAGVLEKAGNDQLRTDQAIRDAIAGLRVHSDQASAAGGSGKGR